MIDEKLLKVVKNVEAISVIGVGIAILLKVFQLPFAGPLIVVFVPTLALVYMYGGFILLKNKISDTENKILLMSTGVALAIGLIGITFKVMYWPNAMNMLLVSNVLLPIVICAAIFLKINSSRSTKGDYNGFLLRALLVYVFAALMYLTSNATLIAFQHRGDNEMIRLKTQSYDHPENKEYKKQLDDYMRSKRERSNSNDSVK